MAIQISNSEIQPALAYNLVFMHSMQIEQRMDPTNDITPKYTMRVEYRLYAVDAEGKRHYRPKTSTIVIEDYIPVAMQKAMAGNTDLVNAMGAIEHALADIIQDQTNLGEAQVV
jgi:hypothetical protein